MMETLIIQRATPDDAPAISALIGGLMPYLTLHPDGVGAEKFKASMAPAAIATYVTAPNYRYLTAFIDGRLAGVAALRDTTHVFHMFVAPAFHRQGVARRLWDALLAEAASAGHSGPFTVNASCYAVAVYARLGFVASGPLIEHVSHGIAYQPMLLAASVRAI
jgi:GNAT superfamily N-acetyltransferase